MNLDSKIEASLQHDVDGAIKRQPVGRTVVFAPLGFPASRRTVSSSVRQARAAATRSAFASSVGPAPNQGLRSKWECPSESKRPGGRQESRLSPGKLLNVPPPEPGAWPRSDDPAGRGPEASPPSREGRDGRVNRGPCAAARPRNCPDEGQATQRASVAPARCRADRPAPATHLVFTICLDQPWIGVHRPRLVSIVHFARFAHLSR